MTATLKRSLLGRGGAGPAEANPVVSDGRVHEAVTVCEQRRYLGIYLTVRLAVIMADEKARAKTPDEFVESLTPAASTCIRQMVAAAGPEIGALLADFRDFVRHQGTSRELMTYASELVGRWNEMQGFDKQESRTGTDVLSPREVAIIELIGRGQSNKAMARQLGIAPETVKTHLKNIFLKLGVERRAQAIACAHALGLIGPGWLPRCHEPALAGRGTGADTPIGRCAPPAYNSSRYSNPSNHVSRRSMSGSNPPNAREVSCAHQDRLRLLDACHGPRRQRPRNFTPNRDST
jgi:DNA-binding CsgD family transcriptional regulator